MNIQSIFTVIIVGYFLGCVQPAYIIGRLIKNIDIRKYGSNNAGASNATIVLGWKYGIFVGFIDIAKAITAVLIVKHSYINSSDLHFLMYLTGAFVILGHNYPFYMRFKGGKGTASSIGMLIALDIRIALISVLIILAVTAITDYIALGTIVMMAGFCICTLLFNYGTNPLAVSVLLGSLSLYNHLPNLKRILKRQEIGLRSTMKK